MSRFHSPSRPRPAQLCLAVFLLASTAVAGQVVSSVEELEYPPLREFEIPAPTRVVLDNGLVVMLLEDHELPLVDGFARIRTGSRLEPAEKVGLAGLTGTVLRTGGTTSMSGDEIDDFLEGKAASIETGIGVAAGSASLSCLAEDLPAVLALFEDILRNPVFDEDKIAVARNQVNSSISRQNDNPQQILFREFTDVVYGEESPYARNPTYDSVAAVTRQDLLDWHGRFFHPNNMILGLVGDFDTEEVLALLRETFADWPAGPAAGVFEEGYDREPRPGVFYVEKGDMTQSNIAIGHLGIQRDDPRYHAVELFNEVFSGGFAARLFTRVRSQKGLAYAVRGSIGSNWDHDGLFQMWMTTKTETTGAGIEALLEEARLILGSEPPTDEEVAKAKKAILDSFVFNSDSMREILQQQLTYEYFGYPLDFLDRFAQGIQEVGTDEVAAAGRELIHPDRFSILVVGPTREADRPLADFGPVTELDISIPEPSAPELEVTPEAEAQGRALMDRVVEGMGGAERLGAVESVRQRATAVATSPQGQMQIGLDVFVDCPDRLRQELTLPFGTRVTVLTPEDAFQSTPRGVQPLGGAQLENTARGLKRSLQCVLRSYTEGSVDAVAAGEAEVDEAAVRLVQLTHDGESFVVGVDPEDGRILRVSFRGTDFTGTPGEVVQTYSDFREVDGILVPFSVDSTFEGEPYIATTLEEVTFDASTDESLFARPAEE